MFLKPRVAKVPDSITDFAFDVCRPYKGYGGTELYGLFINNNRIYKATATEYDYITWRVEGHIGDGKAVAVAFDGRWELNRANEWQLITEERPWMFWTDMGNNLYARSWNEGSTELLLDTGVIKIAALRAWKNVNFPLNDHGLVVAYTKTDGKVYYRNYCEQTDGQFNWGISSQITEITDSVKELSLFITNDYRTGIIIQNSENKIKWYITDRNWAGMAIRPERIASRVSVFRVAFTRINRKDIPNEEYITAIPAAIGLNLLYGAKYNEFTAIENIDDGTGDYGKVVLFSVKYELFNLDPLDFELIDNKGGIYAAQTIMKINPTEYRLEFINFNNAVGDVRLVFKGLYGLNAAGTRFDSFEGVFTPVGLVYIPADPPEVEAIWNE